MHAGWSYTTRTLELFSVTSSSDAHWLASDVSCAIDPGPPMSKWLVSQLLVDDFTDVAGDARSGLALWLYRRDMRLSRRHTLRRDCRTVLSVVSVSSLRSTATGMRTRPDHGCKRN